VSAECRGTDVDWWMEVALSLYLAELEDPLIFNMTEESLPPFCLRPVWICSCSVYLLDRLRDLYFVMTGLGEVPRCAMVC
jgi:hypothetical protein